MNSFSIKYTLFSYNILLANYSSFKRCIQVFKTCTMFSMGTGKKWKKKTEAFYQPVFYLLKCIKASLISHSTWLRVLQVISEAHASAHLQEDVQSYTYDH